MHVKTRRNNVPEKIQRWVKTTAQASQSFCFFSSFILCPFGHVCQGIERSFSVFMTSTLPVLRVQRNTHEKSFLGCVVVVVERGNSSRCNCTPLQNKRTIKNCSSVSNSVTTHKTTMLRAASSKLVKAGLSRGSQG